MNIITCTNCGERKREVAKSLCVKCYRLQHPVTVTKEQRYKYNKTYRKKNYKALTAKRHNIKKELVAYKGGKCQICGLIDECMQIYDFHHTDPGTKDMWISRAISEGINSKKIKKEVDKCILVCSNCHRRVHS